MKKILWVLVVASFVFAGREDISMLNQQILTLQAENQDLKTENRSLSDAIKLLEARVAQLDSESKTRLRTIDEQTIKIEELEKKVKSATAALEMINRSTPETHVASSVAVPVTSLFPISATIMTKKANDGSSIATLIAFYNGSNESVSAFDARLRFSQNGEELLACNVTINKPIRFGENETWYGAIPYNSTDAKNVRFYDADPSSITVHVEVLSVTLSNGAIKKFK